MTMPDFLEDYHDSGYGPLGRWFMGTRCTAPGLNPGCSCDACRALEKELEEAQRGQ